MEIEKEGLSDAEKSKRLEEMVDLCIKAKPEVVETSFMDPSSSWKNIKAITFRGLDRAGKKTKSFAYYAMPENASEENKVPAVVLIHGGGGHPFLEWISAWVSRGYAAIAIETTGYFPTAIDAGDSEVSSSWKHGLSGSFFEEEGYTDSPDLDNMSKSPKKLEDQWMYYAFSNTIIATSILMGNPLVDSKKVGIFGISWGGVIASIVLGYDSRLAFAIPFYGSGYLPESLSYQKNNFGGESTKNLWLAENRFAKAKMPVFYEAWNADNNFSINTNSKSYLDCHNNNSLSRLSIKNALLHSHSIAWSQEEPFIFANSIVKGEMGLPGFINEPSGKEISCTLALPSSFAKKIKAKLFYLTEDMSYSSSSQMEEEWSDVGLECVGSNVSGKVPQDAKSYYVELSYLGDWDVKTVVSSSYVIL